MPDPHRLSDIEFLLELDVTIEDIARRAGRTPEVITAELREIRAERERDNQ
ncbi:hypothetical protein SEA_PRAIRIE_58 [Arthrobacter phage Prairie]|uniref:Uncharacterized protein n=1 Tax=Arthrobacter phage Prairie TaxID=2816463 RepID=A0A8A5LKC5_9CAUD|nr:hypothetical protein SEA_PRAIRIE_58 [Arthrobacter phage Prairie]